ncbi:MAG: hypothetical protein CFH19_00439 [Alphaproteobacteria bacterium MarineAlpha5_Bin9]|nr:MAG: hypothetical protein CFH19_00439 [Alphaproteobacteria bacterium MarineAlpha5_Bin9]|tara:strand:+ start:135 stop:740 length:606 start_codon:yes stop_codon:yes gene_type:complete
MNKRTSDLNLIFATPIWSSIIPNYQDVNKKLYEYINNMRKSNPEGKVRSNLIGWHSNNFDLKDEEPLFFINSISKMLNESSIDMGWDLKKNELKITGMWAIINPTNASNARHIHSNNFISAAYYVKAPENCGNIVFYDPRSANVIRTPAFERSNTLNSSIFKITPKEGLLVLFPSYLHHSVDMNKSNEERIVVSFNMNLIF